MRRSTSGRRCKLRKHRGKKLFLRNKANTCFVDDTPGAIRRCTNKKVFQKFSPYLLIAIIISLEFSFKEMIKIIKIFKEPKLRLYIRNRRNVRHPLRSPEVNRKGYKWLAFPFPGNSLRNFSVSIMLVMKVHRPVDWIQCRERK